MIDILKQFKPIVIIRVPFIYMDTQKRFINRVRKQMPEYHVIVEFDTDSKAVQVSITTVLDNLPL